MDAVKNLLAVFAGIIGVGTAFLTLYAKYLDVKKTAAEAKGAPSGAATEPVTAEVLDASEPARKPADRDVIKIPARRDATAIEQARQAVKAPATTLIAAGLISLFGNLFVAGFGYVDQFVTPLTDESKHKQAEIAARKLEASTMSGMPESTSGNSEAGTVVLTIFALISLSVASVAAAWAGYEMLNLRGYRIAVVGSFAIMAGGLFCCMGGIPIGIWTLSVLYKPEVSSSFG